MFVLLVAAILAWLVVAMVMTNLSPVGDAGAQLFGALALGAAVGLTAWPLLWSGGRRSDGQEWSSGLATAARRAGLVGLVVSILVVLRAVDAVALPVLVFLAITVVLIEVAFTLRR
ncbi:MAG: hypothetical protein ACC726_16085 [Chloroflexota bacterium]